MSPIKGLIKKDYRISRMLFITWLGIALLFMVFGFGISAYTDQPVGTLPIVVITALGTIIFAPSMTLSLLNIEAKNQLWLYSPRNGATLLLTKFAVIFSYQVIIQVILTIYATISLFWFGRDAYEQIGVSFFLQMVCFFNIMLLSVGLYFTTWVTFFWMVFQSLKNNPKIRPFRWLLIIAIYIAYNLFETMLMKIEGIKRIATLYEIEIISNASLSYSSGDWSAFFETSMIPLTPILYYASLTVLLFFISTKLLEQKVEV